MKLAHGGLPALVIAALLGCSASEPAANAPAARPNDFQVDYQWREGSLPPPYHYQYALTITPAGQGEFAMIPDYPKAGVPKWTEAFQVDAGHMDRLYGVFADNGLFTTKWRPLELPPIGGSHQTLSVTAGGKQFTVEDFLVEAQQPAAQAMYDAINALAPQVVRDRLDAKREQYMQEHARE